MTERKAVAALDKWGRLSKDVVVELWDFNNEKAHKGMSVKCRPTNKVKCLKMRKSLLSVSN